MLKSPTKLALLNRSQRRFRGENDVFSAKVNELRVMINCNRGIKRDLLNGNSRTWEVGNHVFGAETIEVNEITC